VHNVGYFYYLVKVQFSDPQTLRYPRCVSVFQLYGMKCLEYIENNQQNALNSILLYFTFFSFYDGSYMIRETMPSLGSNYVPF
jgi:hypothetical protein